MNTLTSKRSSILVFPWLSCSITVATFPMCPRYKSKVKQLLLAFTVDRWASHTSIVLNFEQNFLEQQVPKSNFRSKLPRFTLAPPTGCGNRPVPNRNLSKIDALNTQYALNNERQKSTTPPKPRRRMYVTAYPAGKKDLKALRVDLMFTVGSPKSVSCDAMTNICSCLDENS